jgi:hypothetical protein
MEIQVLCIIIGIHFDFWIICIVDLEVDGEDSNSPEMEGTDYIILVTQLQWRVRWRRP